MRRMLTLLAAAGFFFAAQPLWANSCPRLIREGRDLLAKASLPSEQSDKIKAMLDEAQKLHQSGNHGDSMAKANEALGLLKKP